MTENYITNHSVIDSDISFYIDPFTRQISSDDAQKYILMRGDHHSERFTFKMPRYIEGHDMAACNSVMIHFINAETGKKKDNPYITSVDSISDLEVCKDDDTTVTFSWLVDGNATIYAGVLKFGFTFKCLDGTKVLYSWGTDIYNNIKVLDSISADLSFEIDHIDAIAKWKENFMLYCLGYIAEDVARKGEEVKTAIAEYVDNETRDLANDINALESRMNTFTSLPNGSTTGDAELADGRVDFTGKEWSNIGEHVRETAKGMSDKLVDICDTDLVGRLPWEQGGYGAIWSYTDGQHNASTTRIRAEIEVDNISSIKIERNGLCEYVYSLFKDGVCIKQKSDWQTESIAFAMSDGSLTSSIDAIRIALRYPDGSNIAPGDAKRSGITMSVNNDRVRLSEICADIKALQKPEPPEKLRVMTYNIGKFSYGVAPDGLTSDNYDEKISNYRKFFASQKCDIIGLQECNTYVDAARMHKTNETLFAPLYKYCFDAIDWTCIKSKHKLSNTGTGVFTASNRIYTYGDITIGGRTVFIICVHFSYIVEDVDVRKAEFAELQTLLNGKEYFIVFGDFNVRTTNEFDNITNVNFANGGYLGWNWTYSYTVDDFDYYDDPTSNIRYFDNILVSRNIVIENSEVLNVHDKLSSDHLPVVADLILY